MLKRRGRIGALPMVTGILVIVGALVLAALILGPRREAAPPPSEARQEVRPERASPGPSAEPMAEVTRRNTPLTSADPGIAPSEGEAAAEDTYVIRGIVRARDGRQPVAGALVLIERELTGKEGAAWNKGNGRAVPARGREARLAQQRGREKQRQRRRVRTDRAGAFETVVHLPGRYTIEAVHEEYMPAEHTPPPLEPDNREVSVTVTLSKGGTVMGRVTEEGTGRPAAGVVVFVENEAIAPATTGTDGAYTLNGFEAGAYGLSLNLSKTPYRAGDVLPYQKVDVNSRDAVVQGVDFKVQPGGVVWGHVMTPRREPVQGAEVVLCSSQSVASQALNALVERAPPRRDASEEDGYFELMGVPLDQEWRVYASAENQAPQLAEPFMLTSNVREVRVDIFLYDGSEVSGRAVTPSGSPVPQAQVSCIPGYSALFSDFDTPQAFRETTTGDDGYFEIADLPAGDYQVIGRKEGYKFSLRGTSFFSDGYNDVTGLRVVLEPVEAAQHTVFGTVTDIEDRPLSGVGVALRGMAMQSMRGASQTTTTDSSGRFRFEEVEQGSYAIEASKDGFAPANRYRVPLDSEISITLTTLAVIRGRVLIESSREAPPAYTVSALPAIDASTPGSQIMSAFSGVTDYDFNDPEGHYEIRVAAGEYTVQAQAEGYTPGREKVAVEAGEVQDGVDIFVREDGGRIGGRVTTNDGESPQGAEVTLLDVSLLDGAGGGNLGAGGAGLPGQDERSMRVGEDGAFSFEQLPAGDYIVLVRHDRYATSRSEPLHLEEDDQRDDVNVRLSFGGAIEGTYLVDGRPQQGAAITVFGMGEPRFAETDGEGFFQIDGLAAGEYLVTAAPLGGGDLAGLLETRMEQAVVEEDDTTTVRFDESGAMVEGYCSPPPTGAFMGAFGGFAVVRLPGPAAVPLGDTTNAAVLLQSQQFAKPGPIDGSGYFAIENVPPGEYQLDVYYGQIDLTYVYTTMIPVQDEEVVSLDVRVEAF
ncbi:MAG: collagen binding domain-containing protein [Candidatus Hydrogenedentota bacterium]